MDDEEKNFKKNYREMLEDELDWSDIRREKARFIETHFVAQPFFLFRPAVLVPALSFCLVFAVSLLMVPEPVQVPENAALVQTLDAPGQPAAKTAVESPSAPVLPPHVRVNKLTSDVGSTMIYQDRMDDTPLTVLWVFPSGGTPAAVAR